jgi:hypothetical protein
MATEIVIIAVGMILIIVIMALIMNPPEALIKRVYHRKSKGSANEDEHGT